MTADLEKAAGACVLHLLDLPQAQRREATRVQLSELLGDLCTLHGCPRCGFASCLLRALLPDHALHSSCHKAQGSNESASASDETHATIAFLGGAPPPIAQAKAVLSTRKVLSLMQFVWELQTGSSSTDTAIFLSDSVTADDKLLARFLTEGLQHLQDVEREGGGCAGHKGCPGPHELNATEARLLEQKATTQQRIQDLEAVTGQGDSTDVCEEAEAAAAAAEQAAVHMAHVSLASPSLPQSHSSPAHQSTSSPNLNSSSSSQSHELLMQQLSDSKQQLQQIEQRRKRLARAKEHGLEAGGRRLLLLMLSRCWQSLLQHTLSARVPAIFGTLVCTPHNESAAEQGTVAGGDHSESRGEQQRRMGSREVGKEEQSLLRGLLLLLAPGSDEQEDRCVRSVSGDNTDTRAQEEHSHDPSSTQHSQPNGSLSPLEAAHAELNAVNQHLLVLSFQLAQCQDAQAAMETELAAAVTQADAAQGEADESMQRLRLSLAQWQGDESTLQGMLPEELKDLGGEMEAALGRVRSAHAQATAERELLCPCCWERRKNLVFTCGHLCCMECGGKITACPICRQAIDRSRQIRIF